MSIDLLRPGLTLLFCGYNPSLTSGRVGHNFAHPGNRFWRVLVAAGITDRLYRPEEDVVLLEQGIGFTNIVARPTRRADELGPAEIAEGAASLRTRLEQYRPRAVAYTGIGVYRWLRRTAKIDWGLQASSMVPGIADIVVPSPSGLNRMSLAQLVEHYRVLVPFLEPRTQ
jgi:TDG/mug DNA glycosylase family protein